MSNAVSLEALRTQFGTSQTGITPEGGIFETFINNTGVSVAGTIVIASTTVAGGVDIAPANSIMPIGVIYESGIANLAAVKVVTYGKAKVLLKDGLAGLPGYWCGVSDVAGRMYQQNSPPSDNAHSREIGYSLETKLLGTNVSCLVQLHFN